MSARVVLRSVESAWLDLDLLVLSAGIHASPADGVCVMEAVSIVAGERWSDRPACVSPVIGRFLRRWNDTLPWRPRQGLKRYICPVIGTSTTAADDVVRRALVRDWLVRSYAPVWLTAVGLGKQAEILAGLAPLTDVGVEKVRPVLAGARAAAAGRVGPRVNLAQVQRLARETAWDAAAATLVRGQWGEDQPVPPVDEALVLDLAVTALTAASRGQRGSEVNATRSSAHRLVSDLCAVGQPDRQRWTA